MHKDLQDYIQQLEADKQQLEGLLAHMHQLRDAAAGRALKMEERVQQLEAERDALIDAVKDRGGACATCEHYSNEPDEIPCRFCIEMHPEDEDRISHWQWRGVQKEE